jgi:hypothetical protein
MLGNATLDISLSILYDNLCRIFYSGKWVEVGHLWFVNISLVGLDRRAPGGAIIRDWG